MSPCKNGANIFQHQHRFWTEFMHFFSFKSCFSLIFENCNDIIGEDHKNIFFEWMVYSVNFTPNKNFCVYTWDSFSQKREERVKFENFSTGERI